LKEETIVKTRFCIIPDPILADGTADDVAAILRPDDPELPLVLGRTGIANSPVFETSLSWEALLETGQPSDAKRTGDRVQAAPGYAVEEAPDPF
jgi:hypothetical protein